MWLYEVILFVALQLFHYSLCNFVLICFCSDDNGDDDNGDDEDGGDDDGNDDEEVSAQ